MMRDAAGHPCHKVCAEQDRPEGPVAA
jgi:hypothetical protein